MAPTKQTAATDTASTSKQAKDVGSVLRTIKSTIIHTKTKITALKPQGQIKVMKSTSDAKSRLSERERLKLVIERLSNPQGSTKSQISHVVAGDMQKKEFRLHPGGVCLRIEDFEIGRRLGRGKFGQAYLARHRSTNYICALKIISKAQCANKEEEFLVRRELEVHQNLAHPNILRFISWFHNEEQIYLVLEYAPGGNLWEQLKRQPNGRFNERVAARYIAQMAQALNYMHKKKVIHRDIKPENILLGLHNEIKLADFGYSVHSESGFRSTVCGTLDYLSPEVAVILLKPGKKKDFYTKAVDQWSLGVLTYELLVGNAPFEMKTRKATEKKIAGFKGKIKFPGHVSQGAKDFIRELLNLDAEKRMSLEGVLTHPWITQHLEKSVKSGLRSFNRLLELSTIE